MERGRVGLALASSRRRNFFIQEPTRIMRSQRLLPLVLPLALSGLTSAQSFNIDINEPGGVLPMDGAYPDIDGVWNSVQANVQNQRLQLLTGANDVDSDITLNNTLAATNTGIPAAFAPLYEDYVESVAQSGEVLIDDVEGGDYGLVLYSFSPDERTFFQVFVNGFSVAQDFVFCPPAFPVEGYVPGETLATFRLDGLQTGDDLRITIQTDGRGALNGIQLYEIFGTDVGAPTCTTQPNTSLGLPPSIAGVGSPVASQNMLSLRAGTLPGALPPMSAANPGAIVCFVSEGVGNNVNTTCPSNGMVVTGTACLGPGALYRVPTPNPGAVGFTTTFGTYSLDVDLPALNAQGLNTSAGTTLYFQMVYRDFPDGSCPDPQVRWTNTVAITLQ